MEVIKNIGDKFDRNYTTTVSKNNNKQEKNKNSLSQNNRLIKYII